MKPITLILTQAEAEALLLFLDEELHRYNVDGDYEYGEAFWARIGLLTTVGYRLKEAAPHVKPEFLI